MAITAGNNNFGKLNAVPAPVPQALASNYLDFTGSTDTTWAQQYLPELMEKEAEVFGPRTISGFLAQVGAEEAMTSDQVVWSEQGRLHNNIYQILWRKKLRCSETERFQDFFHK